jgi:hypothetical protein
MTSNVYLRLRKALYEARKQESVDDVLRRKGSASGERDTRLDVSDVERRRV